MKPNIFKSRKFWLMVADVVFSCVLYFGAEYLSPVVLADVKFVIAAIQPVVISLIASIAYEDKAFLENQ